MSKSTIADILEVQRLIGKLDKRGKLAILRDLQKQNLFQPDVTKEPTETRVTLADLVEKGGAPVTDKEDNR